MNPNAKPHKSDEEEPKIHRWVQQKLRFEQQNPHLKYQEVVEEQRTKEQIQRANATEEVVILTDKSKEEQIEDILKDDVSEKKMSQTVKFLPKINL